MRDLDDAEMTTAAAPPMTAELTTRLAHNASSLGYEIVEIAGFIDLMDDQSQAQKPILEEARRGARQIAEANATVKSALEAITASTERSLAAVEKSINTVHASGARTQSVAEWVQALDARMTEVSETLKTVKSNNGAITSIASQVNILAINAKIEAARAGDAGRGFAVVAEAVNELSQKTAHAAAKILESLTKLTEWIETLRREAETVAVEARTVLDSGADTDKALSSIADNVRNTHGEASAVGAQAKSVDRASAEFQTCFQRIENSVARTADGIHQARERVHGLIDQSEKIVQDTVALGGASDDARFIDFVKSQAAAVTRVFEAALSEGRISQAELFDFTYTPIPGTDPEQYTAPFLALTDQGLPPILEAALQFDSKVVFSAAVTKHGYLPTHNRKFSHPQRPGDPSWNAGNSRNRRLFNDRVGLKAGQNRAPFLLQIYRRDMGGGQFKMMKDLSAPIVVHGQHWGGLRMGISF